MTETNKLPSEISKIYKTAVPTDGMVVTIDTIEYEGKLWLVGQWIDDKIAMLSRPVRLIRMDLLPYTKSDQPPHDFLLKEYIAKAVLDGTALQETKKMFEILDYPSVVIRTGGGIH